MVCLHILAESHSEERYVRETLVHHLRDWSIIADVRRVEVSRDRTRSRQGRNLPARIYRGGLLDYQRARGDLQRWMKEDAAADARFTTMFDLYALPGGFPGYEAAHREADPYERVRLLEALLQEDIGDPRLVPYIQLHEFEALVLCDPRQLDWAFIDHDAGIQALVTLSTSYASPELIDDDTPPSKRIIAAIPEYEHQKPSAGPGAIKNIPLKTLRGQCPHFDDWLRRLEALGG